MNTECVLKASPFYFLHAQRDVVPITVFFCSLIKRVLCREETSYKTRDIGKQKVFFIYRREQKCSNFIHRFANAAKPYAAKRKSNEKCSQKTVFSYFQSVQSSWKLQSGFCFFYYPGHFLKDYSTVSHKAQTRNVFICNKKTRVELRVLHRWNCTTGLLLRISENNSRNKDLKNLNFLALKLTKVKEV